MKLNFKKARQGGYDCVYCGGARISSTVDHAPPRGMFDNKHRPNGLVFPSCEECNAGSKHLDQLVSFLSRIYPSPQGEQSREFLESAKAVRNNFPGLIEGMSLNTRSTSALRLSGNKQDVVISHNTPEINQYMRLFAAKMAMGLHWNKTGQIVPSDTMIHAIWYSNHNAALGQIPEFVQNFLVELDTLRQGKMNVAEQFQYSCLGSIEHGTTFQFSAYRQSFACVSAVLIKPPQVSEEKTDYFVPGCLATTLQANY